MSLLRHHRALPAVALGVLLLLMAMRIGRAEEEEIDASKLPPPVTRAVDFLRDIQPILDNKCLRCHGPERPKSRFRLDNRVSAMEGGASGIAIVSGDSAGSPLIHYVARLVEDMEMPPPDKGEPLTDNEIGLLRTWIDTGVRWATEDSGPKRDVSVSHYFGWIGLSGDEQIFREHFWRKPGFGGGLEAFKLTEQLDHNRSVTVEGHLLSHESDYKVRLSMDRRELGFARLGFHQFRRYYDDRGGYYEPFARPQFDLGQDLHIDVGKFWVETGLTLPDVPEVVLGYEFHYRDGTKSLLEWGPSTQTVGGGNVTRKIYPSFKEVDEQVHVVRLDLTHTLAGFELEDHFWFENYDLGTERNTVTSFGPADSAPSEHVIIAEDDRHDRVANAFHGRKKIKEWWLMSGGHFYSRMDANAALASRTEDGAGQPAAGIYWSTDRIILNRESHYLNLNSLFGPWNQLTFSTGVRLELTSQDAMGNTDESFIDPSVPFVFPQPAAVDSSYDKRALEENAILRYTRIPYTVVYGEARFNQESLDQREQQIGGSRELSRDTDTAVERSQYRSGINFSPARWVSVHGSYTHRVTENRYDHQRDEAPIGSASIGYSAFIRAHDFTSDEVEVKLVLKPADWIRTTLSWKTLASDYETETDSISFAPTIVPGGSLLSGNYDANTYSVGLILTPIRRFYCSVTLSYTESRIVSADNGSTAIAPYSGDVYTGVASANYALDEKTSLFGSYAVSMADYRQGNVGSGLPLGTDYRQDAVQVGVNRRVNPNLSTGLRYGYFRYEDSSVGGRSDYSAHAIFATLALSLP